MSTTLPHVAEGMVAQASTEPTKSLKKANGHTSSIINVHAVRMLWVAAMGLFLVVKLGPLLNKETFFSAQDAASGYYSSHPLAAIALSHVIFGLVVLAILSWWYGKSSVYLVDFYTFRPPDRLAGSNDDLVRGHALAGCYNERTMDFVKRITAMSGLGDQTFLPEEVRQGAFTPVKCTFEGARTETEQALFVCIEKLLASTNTKAKEIDALIVNSCSWSPVPSLSSAVVNHFKMKSSILTYNLSGMACTATVIATGLAKELLQNHRNMRVLIASTENVTSSGYYGNQRSMIITNLIFKLGGVAFLMSNRSADRRRSKYELKHVVRTHLAADENAYKCIYQQSDEEGKVGVKIGKELMDVASKAMKMNVRSLAPLVLPASEKGKYIINYLQRKVGMKVKEYTPDFTKAFDHFCIHTGGKAVIDSVEKALKLQPEAGQPCRATFERYGNTSAASTWYNWSYIETQVGVKKGDRVWQLSFGSGFKCCSAVWQALHPINTQHDAWTETPSC